jgi:hypothetical protein
MVGVGGGGVGATVGVDATATDVKLGTLVADAVALRELLAVVSAETSSLPPDSSCELDTALAIRMTRIRAPSGAPIKNFLVRYHGRAAFASVGAAEAAKLEVAIGTVPAVGICAALALADAAMIRLVRLSA